MHFLAWKTLVVIAWLVVATSGASIPEDNSALTRSEELQQKLDVLTPAINSNEETSPDATFDSDGGNIENDLISNNGDLEEKLDDQNYFEGDLNIPREQIMEAYSHHTLPNAREKRDAINERRWPGGIVYYDFHSSVSSFLRERIQIAISEYETETCLRFTQRNQAPSIQFTTEATGCSSSSVGMNGGTQTVSLPGGCGTRKIIIHEIGHAIGLWHEQSRPDRDLYVNVHWENIQSGKSHNFEKRYNVDYQGEQYDYQSVMHYSEKAFTSNGEKTTSSKHSWEEISPSSNLSPSDIEQINRMYKCPQASPGYQGALRVKIIRASDLPDTDGWLGGKPDPYARVVAVDSSNYQQAKNTNERSGTRNPSWNQVLNFGSRKWRYFTITIYDDDSGSDDIMMTTQTIWVQPTCSSSRRFCMSSTQCVYYEYSLDNTNNCSPSPCARGTCYDRVCDFYCNCPAYYSGKRCDQYNEPGLPISGGPQPFDERFLEPQ